MKFTGFGEHAVEYYDDLAADNSKAFYEDTKEIYLNDVRRPMESLLAELEPEFGDEASTAKVFRPYRDLRFSQDKTPYKTHCGAVIERGRGGGAYYVEISAEGIKVAGGCYHTESDQLRRLRTAVDDELRGERLSEMLTALERKGWQRLGDRMKTKPRGVADDHPRLDLLRHRTLFMMRTWEPDDVLHERALLSRVRQAWRQVRPFTHWCFDHIGATEKPAR